MTITTEFCMILAALTPQVPQRMTAAGTHWVRVFRVSSQGLNEVTSAGRVGEQRRQPVRMAPFSYTLCILGTISHHSHYNL